MSRKRILFAIGGNSLIKDKEHLSVEDQFKAVCETTEQISQIIAQGYEAVITHGNGPQVGFILRRSEIANEVAQMHTVPLVSCDADTQGAIGYQLQQALDNDFSRKAIKAKAVTIITQVLVDAQDEAFTNPAKPIGRFYSPEEYKLLQNVHPDWQMVEDAGRGYRRVVPSPFPLEIVELDAIRGLIDQGFTVIAAGGGGIPVVRSKDQFQGVDAVIDKDKASALLAVELGMDVLVISTGVPKVAINFGQPDQRDLDTVTLEQIKRSCGVCARRNISSRIFDSGLAISLFRDNSTRTRFSFASACQSAGPGSAGPGRGQVPDRPRRDRAGDRQHGLFMADVIGIRDDMYIGKGNAYMREVPQAVNRATKEGCSSSAPPWSTCSATSTTPPSPWPTCST
jgi:carbamate kinase